MAVLTARGLSYFRNVKAKEASVAFPHKLCCKKVKLLFQDFLFLKLSLQVRCKLVSNVEPSKESPLPSSVCGFRRMLHLFITRLYATSSKRRISRTWTPKDRYQRGCEAPHREILLMRWLCDPHQRKWQEVGRV
jgi:hypothetical protein